MIRKFILALALCLLPLKAWATCGPGGTCYVNTGCSTSGNGDNATPTSGDCSPNGPYNSFWAFENAENDNLSTTGGITVYLASSDSSADGSGTLTGWTTTSSDRITIIGDASGGTWSDAAHHFSAVATVLFSCEEDYVTFNNVQFEEPGKVDTALVFTNISATNNEMIVEDSLFIEADSPSGTTNVGISIWDTDTNFIGANLMIWGFDNGQYGNAGTAFIGNGTVYLYNVTVSDSDVGIRVDSGTTYTYNTVVNNAEDNTKYWVCTGTCSGDYNANSTADTDCPDSGTCDTFTDTNEFNDPDNATTKSVDLTLKSGGSVLPDGGNSCSSYSYGDTGIDGTACCNSNRDIGADELTCAAGGRTRRMWTTMLTEEFYR